MKKPQKYDKFGAPSDDGIFYRVEDVEALANENKMLMTICKGLLACDGCQCGRCVLCEAREFMRTFEDG